MTATHQSRTAPASYGRPRTVACSAGALTACAALLAVLLAALWWHVDGGRWFVVQTPSMGTALPVGSLALTTPAEVDAVPPGEVVTFRSPRTGTVYTHRVVGVTGAGLRTQGDLNAAADVSLVDDDHLVGRVVWQASVLGWALRAVPYLLIAVAATWVADLLLRYRWRRATWLLGLSVGAAVTNLLLRPWVGLALLGQRTAEDTVDGEPSLLLDIVSTGLLATQAVGDEAGSTAVHLRTGETATVALSAGDSGRYEVLGRPELGLWGWAVLLLLCLLPLLVALVPTRSAEPDSSSPDAPRSAERDSDVGLAILRSSPRLVDAP